MKMRDIIPEIGRCVVSYPSLSLLLGGVKEALLLAQFIYWIGKEDEGAHRWVYKTCAEIEEETGLHYEEQLTARKKLVAHGVLEEHYSRHQHLLFFRVRVHRLRELWQQSGIGTEKRRRKQLVFPQEAGGKSPSGRWQTPKSFYDTENTTGDYTDSTASVEANASTPVLTKGKEREVPISQGTAKANALNTPNPCGDPDAYLNLAPSLKTESFRAAWRRFIDLHSANGKPVEKVAVEELLDDLGGEKNAVEVLELRLRNYDWIGSASTCYLLSADLPELLSELRIPREHVMWTPRFREILGIWLSYPLQLGEEAYPNDYLLQKLADCAVDPDPVMLLWRRIRPGWSVPENPAMLQPEYTWAWHRFLSFTFPDGHHAGDKELIAVGSQAENEKDPVGYIECLIEGYEKTGLRITE